jgi:hypothetical protein
MYVLQYTALKIERKVAESFMNIRIFRFKFLFVVIKKLLGGLFIFQNWLNHHRLTLLLALMSLGPVTA